MPSRRRSRCCCWPAIADLSTPLAWARQEARLAPRGRLVVVPGAGHSVQSRASSGVGRRAVADFLTG